jgi:hypothetical protein
LVEPGAVTEVDVVLQPIASAMTPPSNAARKRPEAGRLRCTALLLMHAARQLNRRPAEAGRYIPVSADEPGGS